MSIPAPLPFENDIHALEQSLARLEMAGDPAHAGSEEVKRVRRELTALKKQKYSALSAWKRCWYRAIPTGPRPPTTSP